MQYQGCLRTNNALKANSTNRCLGSLEIAIKRHAQEFREENGFWWDLAKNKSSPSEYQRGAGMGWGGICCFHSAP